MASNIFTLSSGTYFIAYDIKYFPMNYYYKIMITIFVIHILESGTHKHISRLQQIFKIIN